MPDDREAIPDDSNLFRRIAPDQSFFDQNLGRTRPSTAAFRDANLSVDAEWVLIAQGLGWNFSLRNHSTHFLASITAGFARGEQQQVFLQPAPDQPDNPAHAIVQGNKTKRVQRALAIAAAWIKAPSEA